MRRFFNIQAIVAGTGIAAAATALSFALAVWGFGNLYYASVFMPFAMLASVAVAWFSFLRGDGFARRLPDAGPAETAKVTVPLTEGRLDPALFAPRDGSLVSGRTEPAVSSAVPGVQDGRRPGSLGRAALLWAAVELGAVSALLYSIAGLGARFYR